MTPDLPVSPTMVPTTGDRERVVQVLCIHFARDNIPVQELEARLDRAYKAESVAQLEAILSDLPPLDREAFDTGAPMLAPAHDVPARGVITAILSGDQRTGGWVLPRHLKVIAVLGGAQLDLRDAVLAPGVSEIEVYAVMGGVVIIVPPGVRVESMGSAFLGGFTVNAGDARVQSPSQVTVRVTGLAIMGGVETRLGAITDRARETLRAASDAQRLRRPERTRG